MILQIYAIIHTVISLIAVFTGLVVLFALLAGNRVDGWTKWFLITAVLTTVTGFFFPFHGFTPARGHLSLFQSFRAGRAIVREDSGSACPRTDANRVSVQTYPARRAHDFRFALHCRVGSISS